MKRIAPLLLAAPLVLAACGGGSSTARVNVDPVAFVKQSAQKTARMPSEHTTMAATVSVGSMKLTMSGSGDYVNATKRGQMTMHVSAAGHDIQMGEVMDGTTIYVRSPMLGSQLPRGKTWMKLDLQKVGASQGIDYSSLMGQSPTHALEQLGAAGSVSSVGTETIDGDETTHYRVTNLDISKLPQGAKIQALVHPKYDPIDVWIGNKDGYVHRVSMSFTYSAAGQSGSMEMRIDLSKFGETVDVAVPPANEVLDATSLAGGGLGD